MNKDRAIQVIVDILKGYGAKRIFLFGSVARGAFRDHSDIDLACEGLSPDRFFKVFGKLLSTTGKGIDLVDMNEVKDTLRRRIEREGIRLYEAK